MTRPKRPVVQINITNDQSDLLEFALEVIHHDRYSKTSFFLELIRNNVKDFIDLPHDISLTDEQLLDMAMDKNEQNVISIIGQDKYDKFWKDKESEKSE